MTNYLPETLCIQAGYEPKNGESRTVPIVQSTTYKYDDADEVADLFDLKKKEICIQEFPTQLLQH